MQQTEPPSDEPTLGGIDDIPRPALRVIPMPGDANAGGKVFGGWLLAQIDLAGSVLAVHLARGPVVTRAVTEVEFLAPIQIGDLVTLDAQLDSLGRTSIRVRVEVTAQGRGSPKPQRVATASLVYVAIDDEQRPRRIPRGANGAVGGGAA